MSTRTDRTELVGDGMVTDLARAALFAALLGAFSYVAFPYPFSPAPVTLQVLGVFLAGLLLGPVWGFAACGLYLVAGALGAPVFAGGTAGLGVLLGPTAGYLLSYPLGAALIGWVAYGRSAADPGSVSIVRLVVALFFGTVAIYACGVFGFVIVQHLGPVEAFLTGAAAFLPAEALKIAAAIGIVRSDALAAE